MRHGAELKLPCLRTTQRKPIWIVAIAEVFSLTHGWRSTGKTSAHTKKFGCKVSRVAEIVSRSRDCFIALVSRFGSSPCLDQPPHELRTLAKHCFPVWSVRSGDRNRHTGEKPMALRQFTKFNAKRYNGDGANMFTHSVVYLTTDAMPSRKEGFRREETAPSSRRIQIGVMDTASRCAGSKRAFRNGRRPGLRSSDNLRGGLGHERSA
jgi:hypothetical protein